jgi:hypothetical protein
VQIKQNTESSLKDTKKVKPSGSKHVTLVEKVEIRTFNKFEENEESLRQI